MRNSTIPILLFCALGGAAFAQDAPAPVPPLDAGAVAPAGAIQIALPFNKSIVRESVPVKLRDFPAGGYVAVSLDNQFITAQALPAKRTDPVYIWDTKAGYMTADDPNATKHYGDGAHAISVAVYDAQSKLVGKDTVQVQIANRINMAASQGIKLAYPWNINTRLLYQRRTILTATPADAAETDPGQTVQESLLRYRRTVENVSNGTFLIRDEALPVDKSARPKPLISYVETRGLTLPLQNASAIRPKYRVVDARGRVLSQIESGEGGEPLGFSVPVLPPRRVSVGAHWETPVQMTLDWVSPYPTTVQATSTLEDFEWQDRYPTAKIRETYVGPANFLPRPGSPLPPLQSQDVKFERTIYFAYNAGRIVRMETTLTLTSAAPGLLSSATVPGGPNPYGGGYPGGPPSPGGPGGYPGAPNGNGSNRRRGGPSNPGYPGAGPGGNYPGGNYPGGNYPGGNPNGYPGGGPAITEVAPTKLKYTDTSVIIL